MGNIVNYKVEDAGYYFNPDSQEQNIRLQFKNLIVRIPISKSRHEQINKMSKLAHIFDIYDCNGIFVKKMTGKYCRIELDENYEYPLRLLHIVEDGVLLELNKDKGE